MFSLIPLHDIITMVYDILQLQFVYAVYYIICMYFEHVLISYRAQYY